MSLKIAEQHGWTEWAERIVDNLRTCGYFYDRDFSSNVDNADAIVQAARSLGSLLIPSATDSHQPVLLTAPRFVRQSGGRSIARSRLAGTMTSRLGQEDRSSVYRGFVMKTLRGLTPEPGG